jgi:hypothetical protein
MNTDKADLILKNGVSPQSNTNEACHGCTAANHPLDGLASTGGALDTRVYSRPTAFPGSIPPLLGAAVVSTIGGFAPLSRRVTCTDSEVCAHSETA